MTDLCPSCLSDYAMLQTHRKVVGFVQSGLLCFLAWCFGLGRGRGVGVAALGMLVLVLSVCLPVVASALSAVPS